jgi:hypothetical protein
MYLESLQYFTKFNDTRNHLLRLLRANYRVVSNGAANNQSF